MLIHDVICEGNDFILYHFFGLITNNSNIISARLFPESEEQETTLEIWSYEKWLTCSPTAPIKPALTVTSSVRLYSIHSATPWHRPALQEDIEYERDFSESRALPLLWLWQHRTLKALRYLVRGSEPWLLIGCWGRHCVKSKVMTAADGLRARQGYSHSGCGSASRDSRKSKEHWWERVGGTWTRIFGARNERFLDEKWYLELKNCGVIWCWKRLYSMKSYCTRRVTWTMSSMGVTSKPSHVPHGARILHKSWPTRAEF